MTAADLRVKKTLLGIENSFLELLKLKDFNKITIQQIADRAMINRATFYLHYIDKFDLLEKLIQKRMDRILNIYRPAAHLAEGILYKDCFLNTIKYVFQLVEEDSEFYELLIKRDEVENLKHRFESAILHVFQERFRELFGQRALPLPRDILLTFLSAAISSMLYWWVANNKPYTPEQMASFIVQLSTNGPIKGVGIGLAP
ncbi:DNA-binding transcriptional regulator, AcrR family [Terribacillus halophilus]|uniref:DNA-binding transcriptional regulator, AcrR family n=1 Tax=Terribacillus halophilus TaxID=361279 RepID=A0A1G6JD36_9BACI|nr:TetR/AcrR family transcriptional regulator [Terribacillus halophilus]SDC16579.1 DNA-binding transcriptional regulator, AcrR family [Terribacillus halophilus]